MTIAQYVALESDSKVVKVDDIAVADQNCATRLEFDCGTIYEAADRDDAWRMVVGLLDDLGCVKTLSALRKIGAI